MNSVTLEYGRPVNSSLIGGTEMGGATV